MNHDDYEDILKQALTSQHGILLRYRNENLARYVRQSCYKIREALRKKNNRQYDTISMLITNEGNLKIVKRNTLNYWDVDELEKPHVELLTANELPEYIGSRGRAKKDDESRSAFLSIKKH